MTGTGRSPADLLPDGVSLSEFTNSFWRIGLLHGHSSSAPIHLLDSAGLDDVLRWNLLRYPFAVMTKGGRALPSGSYFSDRRVFSYVHTGYLDGQKVIGALMDGATLYLNHLEEWHPAFGRYLESWARLPVARVVANAFITPGATQSASLHYDDSHNFVVQTEGRKRWRVYAPPPGVHPGMEATDLGGRLLLERIVEPGDVLYFPPGFPHEAEATDGLSIHLTFAAYELMPTMVLGAVVDTLYASDRWKRLPPGLPDGVERATAALDLIRDCLADVCADELFATLSATSSASRKSVFDVDKHRAIGQPERA